MRELVRVIDTYVEMVYEVTSNLNAAEDVQAQPFPNDQPIEEAPAQPAKDVVPS